MDPVTSFLGVIDPLLIAPYRLVQDPMLGWWIGTSILAFWSVLLGELTLALVYRVNRKPVNEYASQTLYYHEQSLKAKQVGDEKAYKGINKLATEAYGKSFFLMIAMGMASLWPAFFAAAWLKMRFGDIVFNLPKWAGAFEISFIAPFVIVYILIRVVFARIKRALPITKPPASANPQS